MFATCIKVKLRWSELLCSWEIVNQHFEKKGMIFKGEFCENLARKHNLGFLLLCHTYNNIMTPMPMFATYGVKWNKLSGFWKKRMFFGAPVQKFWRQFCENQGCKNFVLASCSFKTYCQLHQLAFMDARVLG